MTNSPKSEPSTELANTIEHYNPVHVQETAGLVFISILAFALLIALLRSQARNRALLASKNESSNR